MKHTRCLGKKKKSFRCKMAEWKVMVAIDENENSYYALMWVLNNLKETLMEAPLYIFMAQPPAIDNLTFAASLGSARIYSSVSSAPELAKSVKQNNQKLALAYLEKAKGICASRGVNAEIITEIGDPKTAICDVVQKLNISMLIIGERGLGKIKRAIQGSVSSYCVQYAKCPVLVVKKT
ncbi:universal stress protein A-like protein [Euphorbia lathyris]|uniref:universal stress protein A-like protein n=1 Tax=Euphorbia lathyris TaxID=212925 RepID=UPI0033143524